MSEGSLINVLSGLRLRFLLKDVGERLDKRVKDVGNSLKGRYPFTFRILQICVSKYVFTFRVLV